MSKNLRIIPATELVERATEIARIETTNSESRVWGAVNDEHVTELPAKEDWTFLLASSSLVCVSKYATGTCSVNTGDTAVSFTGATIPTTLASARLRMNDNPNVYEFVRTSSSSGTINPALSGDKNVSGGAYTLSQPYYTLPENFDRFPRNGGLQYWAGGAPTPIPEIRIQGYYKEFSATPSQPLVCRIVQPDSTGAQRVELGPPPDKAYVIPMDYFYAVTPLRETTGGTATVSASGTSVTFHAGARIAEATTGWYFRIDAFGTGAQSEWYRVNNISAATSVATITAFGLSGATSAGYTLCAAPEYPPMLHQALLYGAVKRLLADQKDDVFIYADSLQSAAVNDAKRIYKTRVYNQEIDTIASDYQYRR